MAQAGFSVVWMPPPTDSVSAQGYMPGDLYCLDSKYGSEAQLLSCVRRLQAAGLRVLGDAVLNHRCAQRQDERGVWNLYGGRMAWDQRAIVGEPAGLPLVAGCPAFLLRIPRRGGTLLLLEPVWRRRLTPTGSPIPLPQETTRTSAAAATAAAATSSRRRPTLTTRRTLSRLTSRNGSSGCARTSASTAGGARIRLHRQLREGGARPPGAPRPCACRSPARADHSPASCASLLACRAPRLDFVKGFHGSHVKDYMEASNPYFAVGEPPPLALADAAHLKALWLLAS